MTALIRLAGAALVALALLGPSGASAQETGVAGELERTASTSPQEKIAYATEANEELLAAVRAISHLVEVAGREANVEQLQCLNGRLTAIRALAQVSEAAGIAMKDALGQGESERADHEFRKIAVARTKARQLQAEAELCADATGLRSGDTTVVVDGQDVGNAADTSSVEYDPYSLGFDPPEASPFL